MPDLADRKRLLPDSIDETAPNWYLRFTEMGYHHDVQAFDHLTKPEVGQIESEEGEAGEE